MRGLATRRARWNPRLPLAVGAVVVLGAALPAALAVGGGTMLDDGVRSAVAAAGPADRGTQRPPADGGGEPVTPVVGLAGSFGEEEVQVLAADTAALPAVTHRAGRWALTEDDVRGLASDERGGLPLPPGDTLGQLDSRTGAAVMDLLLRLVREAGTTIVVATHDPALTAQGAIHTPYFQGPTPDTRCGVIRRT
jgi:hypothetical protein